eukprot:10462064-Lingulodinium_polyedra.AAC.1
MRICSRWRAVVFKLHVNVFKRTLRRLSVAQCDARVRRAPDVGACVLRVRARRVVALKRRQRALGA